MGEVADAVGTAHDSLAHPVEQGGIGATRGRSGPLTVAAAGVIGRHLDVEDAGAAKDLATEERQRVLVAVRAIEGHGRAFGTAAGALDDHGGVLQALHPPVVRPADEALAGVVATQLALVLALNEIQKASNQATAIHPGHGREPHPDAHLVGRAVEALEEVVDGIA